MATQSSIGDTDSQVICWIKDRLKEDITKILVDSLSKEDIVACMLNPGIAAIFEDSKHPCVSVNWKVRYSLGQRLVYNKHGRVSSGTSVNGKMVDLLQELLNVVIDERLMTCAVSGVAIGIALKIGALPEINVSSPSCAGSAADISSEAGANDALPTKAKGLHPSLKYYTLNELPEIKVPPYGKNKGEVELLPCQSQKIIEKSRLYGLGDPIRGDLPIVPDDDLLPSTVSTGSCQRKCKAAPKCMVSGNYCILSDLSRPTGECSVSSTPEPDKEAFSTQAVAMLNRVIATNAPTEVFFSEMGILTFVHNAKTGDILTAIVPVLMGLIAEEDILGSIQKRMGKWCRVLTMYTSSIDDQVHLLTLVQKYLVENPAVVDSMKHILPLLYKIDVLDEEAIVTWWSSLQKSGNAELINASRLFVVWLQEEEDDEPVDTSPAPRSYGGSPPSQDNE
jgi:hypothetical protein